jgi:hypothetical protein
MGINMLLPDQYYDAGLSPAKSEDIKVQAFSQWATVAYCLFSSIHWCSQQLGASAEGNLLAGWKLR